jgi:hypothetical protein
MPKAWDQVKEILALALEQSPEQRAGFIRQACGEDAALRAVPSARSRTNIRHWHHDVSTIPGVTRCNELPLRRRAACDSYWLWAILCS